MRRSGHMFPLVMSMTIAISFCTAYVANANIVEDASKLFKGQEKSNELETVTHEGIDFYVPSRCRYEEDENLHCYYPDQTDSMFLISYSDMPVEINTEIIKLSMSTFMDEETFEEIDAGMFNYPAVCAKSDYNSGGIDGKIDMLAFYANDKLFMYALIQPDDAGTDYEPTFLECIHMMGQSKATQSADDEPTTDIATQQNSEFTMSPGTYIVGEDIDAGTYSISITSGNYGNIMVFKDYDSFLSNNASMLDAISDYYVAAPGNQFDFQSEIGSLRLIDGMCLYVNGVSGNMVKTR